MFVTGFLVSSFIFQYGEFSRNTDFLNQVSVSVSTQEYTNTISTYNCVLHVSLL